MKTRRTTTALVAAIALLAAPGLVATATAQEVPHAVTVSADPVNNTPHVLDGDVFAVAEVGSTILLGGNFTQARDAGDGTPVQARANLMAYDRDTGLISQTFVPAVDGVVRALEPAGDGTSVYVGGAFNTVNGQNAYKITRLDVTTGLVVGGFNARLIDAAVWDVKVNGNRLFIGGLFTKVNKVDRLRMAELDATTGALSEGFTVPFEGTVWGGVTQVTKFDVTPDGSRMAVVGNFRTVGAQTRVQVATVDLTVPGSAVTSWRTTRWEIRCGSSLSTKYDVRDLDMAPDGSYFVIGATGGHPAAGALCDGVSRWETFNEGSGQEPTWFDLTGGDSVYSVAATETAVYVGGHFRWLNNPIYVQSYKGPGAVDREGIAAVDPVNGVPLAWNPGRDRGRAVWDMVSTPTQLLVGSDTDRIGRFEYHARIAAFPVVGGTPVPQPRATALPADVYLAGPPAATSSLRRASSFTGTAPAPAAGAISAQTSGWDSVTGAFVADGQLYQLRTDRTMTRRDFDGVTTGPPTTIDLLGLTTFANEMPSVTSLFYDEGRMYYTLSNQNALYMRYLTVESGIVGATRFTVTPTTTGMDWRQVRGAFLAGGQLYWSNSSTGTLSRLGWADRAPVPGSNQVVSGPATDGRDWRARALFAVPAAGSPQVTVTQDCTGTRCTLTADVTGVDPATISGYAWQLGDGSTATGPSVTRTYAPGTFTAQVTVTTTAQTSGTGSTTVTVTNAAPVAAATVTCAGLECTFDGSGSTDADGTVGQWSWDAGDGTQLSGQVVTHTYAGAGPFPVTLQVQDDRGATAQAAATAEPVASGITAVTAASNSAQVTAGSRSVVVPTQVQAGDVLTLFAVSNGVTTLTAPAGWTAVAGTSTATSSVAAWTRVATGAEAGQAVPVTSSTLVRADLSLSVHRGASVGPAASRAETSLTATHQGPAVDVAQGGSWVISWFADKSAATTSWTAPAGTQVRSTGAGTGAGHLSHLLVDSGGPVPVGSYGPLTAVAGSASANAAAISVVLLP